MYHSFNAGRLREYVAFYTPNTEPDEFGQVSDRVLVWDARAEVRTVSGGSMQDYGTTLTSTIITCLMWYNESIANDQIMLWDGVEYAVQHYRPDDARKSMIVTCEVVSK